MKLKTIVAYWLPLFIYMSLIFYLSSLPNKSFNDINEGFGLDDSVEHFLEYSLLSILFLRVLKHHKKLYPRITAVAFSTLYGISDEIHQLFVLTRVFSFNDIIFDLIGILAAVILFSLIYQRRKQ